MLNARQQAFVNEYARGGFKNASEAAVKAGYSAKTAAQIATRLLKNVQVAEAIEARREPAKEEAIVDAAFVLRNLRDMVEVSMKRVPTKDVFGEDEFDGNGERVYRIQDPAAANTALKTLTSALGLGREQENKDATIKSLAETLQAALKK